MSPIIYDKAKYHTIADWPENLDQSQSFVLGGLFLGWLIDRNLLNCDYWKNDQKLIEALKNHETTGPQIYEYNDGVLSSVMLDDEGNAFTQFYFDYDKGEFLSDYRTHLASYLPSIYHVQDTWLNYEKLKFIIDQRYKTWKLTHQ